MRKREDSLRMISAIHTAARALELRESKSPPGGGGKRHNTIRSILVGRGWSNSETPTEVTTEYGIRVCISP